MEWFTTDTCKWVSMAEEGLKLSSLKCYSKTLSTKPMVPNLEPPDVLGLQFPEALTITSSGQDFWELKSKNIWRPKVGDHCTKPHRLSLCDRKR